ncbi:DUF2382 domain-containing protein [Actinomycetospora chiangmaiensis]|uniref:DUF2382 domain-containing protein n=1 Tax=Actinomycetospora chiangmaiensis TaxID=402650 RepID=UPI00037D2D6A|nr:PRC and DUF2382 domain-containing protein [Actinomycetospora chiangmaiensis]
MAVNTDRPQDLYDATVIGENGEKLGKVDAVFLDNRTRRPEWAAVKTGLFGIHVSLVPLARASSDHGALRVPYSKDEVQKAPHHDPDRELSVEEEKQLFDHYGVEYGGDTATARTPDDARGKDEAAGTRRGAVGHDTSGPTTDEAMTRSEEELHVGTETRERGRARLRKYVVTETVTETVPVSREEVRVEREPITEENAAAAHDGPAISEEEHEVVLHEERPVVGKETVAKERVRLGTETQRDHEQVSEEVRKEHIETPDEAADTGRSGRR